MANKFDNEVILDGAAVGAVSNGWLEWDDVSTGAQQGGFFSGNGAPIAGPIGGPGLGGRLVGKSAVYLRLDAVSAITVLYVTFDFGNTWTALS